MNKFKNSDSTSIPFHTVVSANLVGGAAGIIANPNGLSNGGRLLTEADGWAHFRIRKLQFRLHPVTTSTNVVCVGFVGGAQDASPSTVATVGELIPSAVLGSDTTVPTEWVRVPKVDLSGPLPWYKAIAGSADATEEAPGAINVAGTSTEPYLLEIRGVVDFKVAVSAANTPAELALRAKLRLERQNHEKEAARHRLLAVIGCAPTMVPVGMVPNYRP